MLLIAFPVTALGVLCGAALEHAYFSHNESYLSPQMTHLQCSICGSWVCNRLCGDYKVVNI